MSNPMNNNMIAYSGKVKILYQDAKGKYRVARYSNAGKISLFTFLTHALQGTYVKDLAPRYLNGVYVDGDNTYPAFIQKVILAKTPVRKHSTNSANINSDMSDCIEYCFTINPSILLKSNYSAINRLQLINSRNEVCAEIDLYDFNAIQVESGSMSNIVVYWTLQFMNVADSQAGNTANPLTITFNSGRSTTKHFTDTNSITINWVVNRSIGQISKMYCNGEKCDAASDSVSYNYIWRLTCPEPIPPDISTEVSTLLGVGSSADNLNLSETITCTYTHYVYCGFSDKTIENITSDDIKQFSSSIQATGNLISSASHERKEYVLPDKYITGGGTGAYLYYAVPMSYVGSKKVVISFMLGITEIPAPARTCTMNYAGNDVEYAIYRITDYKQTGNVEMGLKLE